MECPFTKTHSKDFMQKLGIESKDGKCPARDCPVLKDYVKEGKDPSKCPFLKNHNCSFFKKMLDNCEKK